MLDPTTRSRIAIAAGRAGGLANVARHGRHKVSACATSGFIARFEREVDPNLTLAPEERASRARFALKAHMAMLSLRSAQKRAAR